MTKNICPVCGYDGLSEPAYKDGYNASYEICPSCSYQFGYHDEALEEEITFEQWRAQWVATGMIWDKNRSLPPVGWNPRKQFENVGVFLP